MDKDKVAFCTGFVRSNDHLVDFYQCVRGHGFGVDHISDDFRKESILCPVCHYPASFKETMRFEARDAKIVRPGIEGHRAPNL
ncbi:MAG: hypothetical protein HXX80_01805 [Nitrososphaerales archaeon]|nr:hypothetical protein [Nitrososphaerales archaeon]